MDKFTNEEWKVELDEVAAIFEDQSDHHQMSTLQAHTDIKSLSAKQLASYIDHTVLKLDATDRDVDKLCDEAKEYGFAAVCVRGNFVARAVANLAGTDIGIACVVGFHEGTQSTEYKVDEAQRAMDLGATELDVVLNRDVLQAEDYAATYAGLAALRRITPPEVHLKLILETSMLSTRQIMDASVLAAWAQWDYIKTSTGFCGHGATVDHVRVMKQMAEVMATRISKGDGDGQDVQKMKIKASGGIRSFSDCLEMISAGADRIGASAGVSIMIEAMNH